MSFSLSQPSAGDHYAALRTALAHPQDLRQAYKIYNAVFHLTIEEATEKVRLTLCGPFAKTDYLLKEHQAPIDLARAVHHTRHRLKRREQLTDDERQAYYRYDAFHLASFFALLSGEAIPDDLAQRLPKQYGEEQARHLVADVCRLLMSYVEGDYLYGTLTSPIEGLADLVKVCYAAGNHVYPYDWHYLAPYLKKDTPLNLIRPRLTDDVLYPELIILWPDFLVDISAVASGFAGYDTSALPPLLHTLQPAAVTEPILMGHLASTLLDAQIRQPDGVPAYTDIAQRFYVESAVSLLAVPSLKSHPFPHKEAREQQQNIARALLKTLPDTVSQFRLSDGIVEPSFYSEMLGLQGRMDYLQADYRVLLEQKSGKGAFPPSEDPDVPRYREEHYVQLLLYMLLIRYNHRQQYEHNGLALQAYLLYSKYKKGLLGLGFAPRLIFQALKVRNEIAQQAFDVAEPHGFDFLATLTAEDCNQRHLRNTLWYNFLFPQLTATLAPIHHATPLERAYIFRLMTFVACERICSKVGGKTHEGRGFADLWHESADDRREAGNLYDGLTLLSPDASTTEGTVNSLVFSLSPAIDYSMAGFRAGDLVCFYPYAKDQVPDVRQTMLFRGMLVDIQPTRLIVSLHAAQTDKSVFLRHGGEYWAVERDLMESAYTATQRGLSAFFSAPEARRRLLLFERPPRHTPRVLKGDYGAFNSLVQRVKEADDFFLLIGPPGTGKTSFGLLNNLKEALAEPDSAVLLAAYTHRAVDEICSKLVAEGIDFIRYGHLSNCPEAYRPYTLAAKLRDTANLRDLRECFMQARVFVGTVLSFSSTPYLLALRGFSLAIIDEASQLLEPHLMPLFAARLATDDTRPAIRKFLLIGDEKQLPAVVQQTAEEARVDDEMLHAIGLTDCRHSLFERLLKRYHDDPAVTYMFTRQGRMHVAVSQFPSEAFYHGRLHSVPLPHQEVGLPLVEVPSLAAENGFGALTHVLATERQTFFALPRPVEPSYDNVNPTEAKAMALTLLVLYVLHRDRGFQPLQTVGLIVPYRSQIAAVRNEVAALASRYHLDEALVPLQQVTIDTVERYQGSQRDIILYGFTAQRRQQLKFLTANVFTDDEGALIDRKLNVALTRAREQLFLFGHPSLLQADPVFARLLAHYQAAHAFCDISQSTALFSLL